MRRTAISSMWSLEIRLDFSTREHSSYSWRRFSTVGRDRKHLQRQSLIRPVCRQDWWSSGTTDILLPHCFRSTCCVQSRSYSMFNNISLPTKNLTFLVDVCLATCFTNSRNIRLSLFWCLYSIFVRVNIHRCDDSVSDILTSENKNKSLTFVTYTSSITE